MFYIYIFLYNITYKYMCKYIWKYGYITNLYMKLSEPSNMCYVFLTLNMFL